jgi:predicted metal-dependent hydrolase
LKVYDRLYLEFIYYFNNVRDYFECHEVMEELWLGEGRSPLYQGLLQVAVGLYHHRNGNVNGAIKLFGQAIDKLERYPEDALGIDLKQLLVDSHDYLFKLQRIEHAPFEFYDLNITVLDPMLVELVEGIRQHPPTSDEKE